MTSGTRTAAALIAPYAVWMALMAMLPPTAEAYAVRAAATALALAGSLLALRPRLGAVRLGAVAAGALAGLAVLAVWVLPERFEWYRRLFVLGEGGTLAVAESSAALIAARLAGSALVIPVAEELFFRRWLLGFAGFGWSVALFAVEHDRWLVGAIAGAVYGLVCLRGGLAAAIVAHATTNLGLGLYVLRTGSWQFW